MIKNDRGETLTETLVATLIASIALVMLAAMITTASSLTKNSSETLVNYFNKSNLETHKVKGRGETLVIKDKAKTVLEKSLDLYQNKELDSDKDKIYSYTLNNNGGEGAGTP